MMQVLLTKKLALAGFVSAAVLAGVAGAQIHRGNLARAAVSPTSPAAEARAASGELEAGIIGAARIGSPDRENGARRAYGFYFTRGIYSARGRWGWGGRSWATDFPEADRHFLTMLRHLTNVDANPMENPIRLDDPKLRRFPFLYILEVGFMHMTDEEAQGLRDYILAGGFVMIDDFHGTIEWNNFEQEMLRILPDYPIVDIPSDHPIFSTVYQIDEIVQVPEGRRTIAGGQTWERDGFTPQVRGIFDDKGRLMVVINWNTDLGDGLEFAYHPLYPVKFSTYAFQISVNTVVYAMSN